MNLKTIKNNMKTITAFLSMLFATFLFAQPNELSKSRKYIAIITEDNLNASLHFLAADYFKGRGSGTEDEKAAASYLASCYMMMNIPSLNNRAKNNSPLENYFQNFEYPYRSRIKKSQNVIAVMEGSDPVLKKEAIIIIAHYDHLGKDTTLTGDQIFNGAADDGSGTVALLQIARSFATARDRGEGPKRSVILFHAGAEENGVRGSGYYVNKDPLWPLDHTSAVINLDGVGGTDVTNLGNNHNYIYILHADSTSSHLYNKTKELNKLSGINLEIMYPKNAAQFASDNRPFIYELVPNIFFSTGLVEHYHKVSDEAGTIDYSHMAKITKLIFALSWELSMNRIIRSTFDRNKYTKTANSFYCIPCGCSKDKTFFDKAGICDACNMELVPSWEKIKSK
jgi:hypothetical protein